MNAPPLIRPLRQLLQRQLLHAPDRLGLPAASVAPSRLVRYNASIAPTDGQSLEAKSNAASSADASSPPEENSPRHPRSLSAFYLRPLRREAPHGVPTCNLQLRSYNPRSLEFFCDFALRAAYYLGLPATGPVPLPRITERWTVPKAHFIDKKSQENFERVTYRRLIQIRDGHVEPVHAWLAYLQKRSLYGVGMKASVWEFSGLDVAKKMDESMEEVSALLEKRWAHLAEGQPNKPVEGIKELLATEQQKLAVGG